MLVAGVLVVACRAKKPANPDPDGAIRACVKALNESEQLTRGDQLRHTLIGCEEMYSHPYCRGAVHEFAERPSQTSLDDMGKRCAAAYCRVLAEPLPALCITGTPMTPEGWAAFTESVFRYELGSIQFDTAKVIDFHLKPAREVARWLRSRSEPQAPPSEGPQRSPSPTIELRGGGQNNTVTLRFLDGGYASWNVTSDPLDEELAAMRRAIAEQKSRGIRIRSEKNVLFLLIKRMMATAADAGSDDIAFELIHDEAPDAGP